MTKNRCGILIFGLWLLVFWLSADAKAAIIREGVVLGDIYAQIQLARSRHNSYCGVFFVEDGHMQQAMTLDFSSCTVISECEVRPGGLYVIFAKGECPGFVEDLAGRLDVHSTVLIRQTDSRARFLEEVEACENPENFLTESELEIYRQIGLSLPRFTDACMDVQPRYVARAPVYLQADS